MKLLFFIFSKFYRVLRKMPYLCGMTGKQAKLISKRITSMFIDELINPHSIYHAKTHSTQELARRISLATCMLKGCDADKVKHFEDKLILKGLYKYEAKGMNVTDDIRNYSLSIIKNPQPEIEKVLPLKVSKNGFWFT